MSMTDIQRDRNGNCTGCGWDQMDVPHICGVGAAKPHTTPEPLDKPLVSPPRTGTAAGDGEEFGAVIMQIFAAAETAKDESDDD